MLKRGDVNVWILYWLTFLFEEQYVIRALHKYVQK